MTTKTNQTTANCTVCRQQKHELRPRKSKLIPGMQLWLCNACFSGKKEPRFAVILVGRRDGLEAVQEYLKSHRYVGEDIPASELV